MLFKTFLLQSEIIFINGAFLESFRFETHLKTEPQKCVSLGINLSKMTKDFLLQVISSIMYVSIYDTCSSRSTISIFSKRVADLGGAASIWWSFQKFQTGIYVVFYWLVEHSSVDSGAPIDKGMSWLGKRLIKYNYSFTHFYNVVPAMFDSN